MLKLAMVVLWILIILSTAVGEEASPPFSIDLKEKTQDQKKEIDKLKKEKKLLETHLRQTKKIKGLEDKNKLLALRAECESNESKSCITLALHYLNSKKTNKAAKLLRPLCEKKNLDACKKLGGHYFQKKNFRKAAPLLGKACQLKAAESCNEAAYSYFQIRKKNVAMGHFKKACEFGLANGCYNLAEVLANKKKWSQAKTFYRLACLKGNDSGCKKLKKSIESSDQQILTRSARGCQKGDLTSCFNAGYLSLFTPDPKQGQGYFQKACSAGDLQSCGYLAIVWDNPGLFNSVSADYQKLCSAQKARQCYLLSMLYAYQKQDTEFFKYFELALKLGFTNWARIEKARELVAYQNNPTYIELRARYQK